MQKVEHITNPDVVNIDTKKKKKLGKKAGDQIIFWLFLTPTLFAFLMVIVIPFIMGIYYSFTNWSATSAVETEFVGFSNYITAIKEPAFLYTLLLTTIYTLLSMIAINIVSFSL